MATASPRAGRAITRTQVELRHRLKLFVGAYNYGRRLEALRGLTPYEFICQAWMKEAERFRLNPSHHATGLNIRRSAARTSRAAR